MTSTKSSALKAHGRYPKVVYRVFAEARYAEDFALRGRFRLGNLRVYARMEDAERRDSSEGQGYFQRFGTLTSVDFFEASEETAVRQKPGYIHTHTELLNPVFILSCARPGVDLDYLRSRFGPCVVRIDQPRRLAQELSSFLETHSDRFTGVEGCLVHYNKGGKVGERLSNIASTRLSYAQKPTAFTREQEFRFVVMAMGLPSRRFNGSYLTVDLGRALDYVRVI